MTGSATLQTVFNRFLPAYQTQHSLKPHQYQACSAITQCRTETLGGLQMLCGQCDYSQPQYHSCRNRHCPQCQGQAQQAWSDQQMQNVLPVTYYHLVFTLPSQLNAWIEIHPNVIYRLLFQSTWATLDKFGQDPKRLNGSLGMTAVLHTWGQTLTRHVHLHCIVPGGALTSTGEWNPAKSNYLFPVKALSRHYRGKMVSLLRQAAESGELDHITRPDEIDSLLNSLMKIDWVVYTQACFNRAETIVNYLARYSRKTALNNSRILSIDDHQVHLRYKDYRDNNRNKVMALEGEELIRRFLLHILPKGFMRIRHYGFLANRCRQQKLEQVRSGIKDSRDDPATATKPTKQPMPQTASLTHEPQQRCPKCKIGHWVVVYEIARRGYDSG